MMKVFVAVLLLTLSQCHSEVVNSFKATCPQFFANPDVRSPPTILSGIQYKQICQKLNNKYEFATLYDTKNRIPVYSAYEFKGIKTCKRLNTSKWYIEPQLEDRSPERKMKSDKGDKLLQNQAVNEDYIGSGYHKGHLVPVYHANEQSCANATFTLTNAAPQNRSLNTGQWRVAESNVAEFLESERLNNSYSAYIVTGVVPGTGNRIKERVNIPSRFWSAFCCLDNNKIAKSSGGYYGKNQENNVTFVTLRDLENSLQYEQPFSVFDKRCYMNGNELDMWLIYNNCKNKGGNIERFREAKQCIDNKKEKVDYCVDTYCTRKRPIKCVLTRKTERSSVCVGKNDSRKNVVNRQSSGRYRFIRNKMQMNVKS